MTAWTYDRAPRRVYWELTRACDLACRHCRAEARPARGAEELETAQCLMVIRELASTSEPAPHIVFTGGDPLKRPDLLSLVDAAVSSGLPVAVAPSATFGVTGQAVRALRRAGVEAMSLSIDGPSAARHDAIRGVLGCFGWTLAAAQRIVGAGIALQVNTLVCQETVGQLEAVADVVARLGAARWSLFFLVPVGRGQVLTPLEPVEAERTLRWLAARAGSWPFQAATTEAPQYRRVALQRAGNGPATARVAAHGPGMRDGNGVMFIAASGDVTPSGFLPLPTGNVRQTSPLALYRTHPLFRALRDPDHFHGRCGVCPFRQLCGGSRARAWAASGDPLGEDPLCGYDPGARTAAAA